MSPYDHLFRMISFIKLFCLFYFLLLVCFLLFPFTLRLTEQIFTCLFYVQQLSTLWISPFCLQTMGFPVLMTLEYQPTHTVHRASVLCLTVVSLTSCFLILRSLSSLPHSLSLLQPYLAHIQIHVSSPHPSLGL